MFHESRGSCQPRREEAEALAGTGPKYVPVAGDRADADGMWNSIRTTGHSGRSANPMNDDISSAEKMRVRKSQPSQVSDVDADGIGEREGGREGAFIQQRIDGERCESLIRGLTEDVAACRPLAGFGFGGKTKSSLVAISECWKPDATSTVGPGHPSSVRQAAGWAGDAGLQREVPNPDHNNNDNNEQANH
ncbi:unnamed protein product [Lampetra fluviatilis]